jgi:hypothetical protein
MKFFTFLLLLHISTSVLAQLEIKFPPARMVYQRNPEGNATVFITGTYIADIDKVEARLKTRVGEPGSQVGWTPIGGSVSGNVFAGSLIATGGRYDLEVRGMKNNQPVGSTITVEKVGIGEVFLIVGHSNADAANSTMTGANSDMVNSINIRSDDALHEQYLQTGSPSDLQDLLPTKLCQTCGIGPMSGYPWLWSKLGDLLVSPTALNVPILFYSAAFGGSNMDQTYKSAYNIPFDHGFIKYSIRMPYVNIRNTLTKYVPQTGLRAILSLHGVNDQDTDGDGFKFRNQKVIEKTREESNYQKLAWMIALDCYNNGINQSITNGQLSLIATVPDVFRGGNLNLIDGIGRYDGLHFNEFGQQKAAELWRDAILDPTTNFIQNAKSLMATAPPVPGPPLPVTLVSFNGRRGDNGRNELKWVTSLEESNDYFEVQRSTDALHFEAVGNVKGVGDTRQTSNYAFTDEPVASDLTYYRLKQVDFDGTSVLSRIIAVRNESDSFKEFVFPNPAQHYVEIATDNGSSVEELALFDLKGNPVIRQSKTSHVDITSLVKGEYYIQIRMSSGQVVRKKITKM